MSVLLDDLEAMEWPTRLISTLHDDLNARDGEYRVISSHIKTSVLLMLGISFTILIFSLMLDRICGLILLLASREEKTRSFNVMELLLLFSYVVLVAGFIHYMLSWLSREHRVRSILKEIQQSELSLEPVLISSRQPVIFARNSSKSLKNVVIQGIKGRFLSMTVHLQLPYNTKFTDFHLEIIKSSDVSQSEQCRSGDTASSGGKEWISVEHRDLLAVDEGDEDEEGLRKAAAMLRTNDLDAYEQLLHYLKNRRESFESFLRRKSFQYLSIDQIDRGGFAIYKIHLHHEGINRDASRQQLQVLQVLVMMFIEEHEPTIISPSSSLDETFSFPPSRTFRKSSIITRLPSRTSSTDSSLTSKTTHRDVSDVSDVTINSKNSSVSPKVLRSSNDPMNQLSNREKGKMISLKELFRGRRDQLGRYSLDVLGELEKLLARASSFQLLSGTKIVFHQDLGGLRRFQWEVKVDAEWNAEVLELIASETDFVFSQSIQVILRKQDSRTQWNIDVDDPQGLARKILQDPVIGEIMNEFIAPVRLQVSTLDGGGQLEVIITFLEEATINVHFAYILAQELPWLIHIFF